MNHTYKLKWGSITKPIGNGWSNSQVYIYAQVLWFY